LDSLTDIANTALSHLGAADEIQDILTDTSKEARVMRRYYKSLLKSLIASKAWWWATRFERLALQSIYPTPEWPFAYKRPVDSMRMVRIWNHLHTDTLENEIIYLNVNNGSERVIVSEYGPTSVLAGTPWAPIQPTLPLTGNTWPIPVAQFTAYTEDCSLMPEMFKQGYAFILAAYAAPSLPGIGQVDLRLKNLELGNAAINQALADDQNENRPPVDLRSIIQKAGQGEGIRFTGTGFRAFNPSTWPGGA